MSELLKPNFQIIGHRGSAGFAPENTLSSFKRAAEIGLNWVEFDIQQCGSGEWIVFHDEMLERTTNGQGNVAETPYELIKKLDAGSWFNPLFLGERVPLFSETLGFLAQLSLHPNIEIKSDSHIGNKSRKEKLKQVNDFLKCLNTHGPSSLHTPLISSFDIELLSLIRTQQPSLPIGYLVEEITPQILKTAVKKGFNSIHCNYKHLQISTIKRFAQHLPLLVYTINDSALIEEYLSNGVTAVFSDMTHTKYSPL